MKARRKSVFPYIIMILVTITCYRLVYIESIDDILSFISTVLSMVVSLYAYMLASKTYQSIDSVNVITQMDGNVLENESYVTPMTLLLKEYDMEDPKSLGEKVFDNLERIFTKESKTAATFADNLQYFIDIIVFFPYLFNHKDDISETHLNRMDKILKLIKDTEKELINISNGNLVLIQETVKLIICVINYQKLVYTSDEKTTLTLLEVRGNMLKNTVTQTVYYNYLGLFYNAKANHVIRKKFNLEKADFFSIDVLKTIKNSLHLLTDEENELFTMYLQEAKKAFQKALKNGEVDMMWEGFIKFNEARTTYFLELLNIKDPDRNWISIMNEAIIARNRLNILMKDIFEENQTTHLQDSFIFESLLGGLVRLNIMIVEKMDITDPFDRPKFAYPLYEGLLSDPLLKEPYQGKYSKINSYQDRIHSLIEANCSQIVS